MWDLRVTHPFGRISARKFLTVVAALVMTTFAYIFVSAPITHAADASWNGASIMYNSHQFIATGDAVAGDSHGLTPGSKVYLYTEPAPSGGQQKADLIYFTPPSDPKTATSAEFATYDFIPPDKFSNKSPPTTVSLTPQDTGASTGKTSCDSTFTFGIGWIVCPVTNFLSSAMDWIFGIVSDFLTVRPVQTNQDNSLYRAWSYMRNFANIAFVIGFMIIIYSQLTSLGLSNYGIKRILPRLIIAAILVNVSYWLCAIAIDISNIAGYAIQDLFIGLRNGLVGNEGNGWNVTSWKSISGFILSGGTAAVATGVGVHLLLAGTIGGALYLLLPIIMGALIAVLVALLVMAARQAIVIIMVILSPLAFVAYLLPNTEKYFDKWKDLFLTMLIMFPAFSVIFGGAQLAGVAIIQNADSINLIILGMAVQVAPLAITPLLLKFSGSLLGKIAGIANNPSRGLVDRTRKFAQERADQHKAGVLANPGSRRRDAFRRKAVSIDYKKRDREGLQKGHEEKATAEYAKTRGYSDNQQRVMEAKDIQELGDSATQLRYVKSKYTNAAMQQLDTDVRANKSKLDTANQKVESDWDEFKAGDIRNTVTPAGLSVSGLAAYRHARNSLAQNVLADANQSRAEGRRKQAAEHTQSGNYAHAIQSDPALLKYAAGIDPNGQTKVEAAAIGEIAQHKEEDVAAGVKLLNFKALAAGSTLKNYSARVVRDATAGTGAHSAGTVEAALEAFAQEGNIFGLENARLSHNIDQGMLSEVIARNAATMKDKGGFHLQADPALSLNTTAYLNSKRADTLGNTAPSNMGSLKRSWVTEVANNINTIIADSRPQDLAKTYDNIYKTMESDLYSGTIYDMKSEFKTIRAALEAQGYTPSV